MRRDREETSVESHRRSSASTRLNAREEGLMMPHAEIFWSDEDKAFVAVDATRPGCSSVGDTEAKALDELQYARAAWDAAAKAVAALSPEKKD